ncbi:MAG: hypothetical protein A2Y12_04190 [Planctomycetes bacterium GWF2_42_9]|nr:MAG: hypothetical protein A2Y12_04190 [Planctomycetes bacterium GWF2_42_9]HAL45839.1 hypothetical protein [Phycisphaerales bacterium]
MFWIWKKKFKTITDCIDIEKGKPFLIIGAGGTLKEYQKQIKAFIEKKQPVTIGINKMTDFHIPDYHLWTNKQRWKEFGNCVNTKSKIMFASDFKSKLINQHFKGNYISVSYIDKAEYKVGYQDGIITGHFRTAGCLAIMVAHLFGASEIFIAGMDGYTLYRKRELEQGQQNQHVYGSGFTDDASWQECLEKDQQVYDAMKQIEEYGVHFKIITPTKFEKYYDSNILKELANRK